MNIFALDTSPLLSATYHVDRHTVKMILEYCQLLSTAHRILDGDPQVVVNPITGRKKVVFLFPTETHTWREIHVDGEPKYRSEYSVKTVYAATHVNHPSAIWARSSKANYLWLAELLKNLCTEYTYRYGRKHSCETSGIVNFLCSNVPLNINQSNPFTLPTPAMPKECIVVGDVVASYRRYYVNHKQRMFNWKLRTTPEWINDPQYLLEQVK